MSTNLYRKNVGIIVMNHKGQVLIARPVVEARENTTWQMPQGGLDDDTDIEGEARRELCEETGVCNVRYITQSSHWYSYDFPDWATLPFGRQKFKGQTQKWTLFVYEGHDIQKDILNRCDDELVDFKWADLEDLPGLVIDFKRDVYEAVVAEFTPIIEATLKMIRDGH